MPHSVESTCRALAAAVSLASILLVHTSDAAAGVIVRDAVFSQNVSAMATNVKSKVTHKPGTVKVSEADVDGSIVTQSAIVLCSDPSLSSSISGQSTGYAAGGSVSQMLYFFQVVGPMPVAVPIIVTGHGILDGIETSGGSTVAASVFSNMGTEQFFSYDCNNSESNVTCGTFTTPLAVSVTASTKTMTAGANSLSLQTSLSLALPQDDLQADTIMALLQSSISIDPSFKDEKKYSIVVSKKVCNVQPNARARLSGRPGH